MSETKEILPSNVVPSHYDIEIETLFDTLSFRGNEKVVLQVLEKTNTIVLNSLGIAIDSARIGDLESSSIVLNEERETATITFPQEIGSVGETLTLALTFGAELGSNMMGYYKSKREINGKTHWIATTQFEPVDARRAFPCWDEPSLKATFSMTLIAPSDMTCLSNMNVKSETSLDNGRKRVSFEVSPKMSTYLVAYCVGELESLETTLKSGVKLRVWCVPGKLDQCQFALDNGGKMLEYYENYFGIPFPLPKLDMVALPDFLMGAMENWGLITYRETALLCNLTVASVAAKSRVAYVIAHELAHQWFGNLVTMAWWKELWLNEGFASFIGAQAVAHFYPEWRYWDQFVVSFINTGLKADSSRTSHPIEVEINTARSVSAIFDVISYQKGASVIKMISNSLGEDVFQKGLQSYLKTFSYANTVTKDLWDHLSLASGKDVTNLMDNWVKEMGYPVVSIEETNQIGQFKVTQRRFLGYGTPTEEEDRVIWNINLGVVTESHNNIQYFTIDKKEQILTLPVSTASEWVKLNAGQSGFYRVQYSPELSRRLTPALSSLSAIDRLGLVNDMFSLAFANIAPLSQALEFASKYTDETDPGVWGILNDNLTQVYKLFDDSHPYMHKLFLNLFSKISSTIGWTPKEGEDELWKQARPRILDVLGEHGDTSVHEEAKRRMSEYEKDHTTLPNDIAGVVFKYYARSGGEEEGKKMIEISEKISSSPSSSPELVIASLACVGYGANIELSLKYILESPTVRSQDFIYPWSCICSTSQGKEASWKFMQDNWVAITKKISESLLRSVISACTGFSTQEKLEEVEQFFSSRTDAEIERTVKDRLEAIKTNMNTVQKQKDDTMEFLKNHYSS